MLSAFFLLARAAFSKMLAFTIAHWRIILPLAIVGLILWYVLSLRAERDEAVANYNQLVQLQKDKAAERKLENERKEVAVRRNIDSIMANHLAVINQLRKENGDLQKTNTDAARAIANWRERVRLEVARNAAGLPSLSESADESAGSGGDCNATAIGEAYSTLDLACSITTADYNALWEAWDKACKIHGCK